MTRILECSSVASTSQTVAVSPEQDFVVFHEKAISGIRSALRLPHADERGPSPRPGADAASLRRFLFEPRSLEQQERTRPISTSGAPEFGNQASEIMLHEALLSLPKRKLNVSSPLLRPPLPARGLSSSPDDAPSNLGNVGFIGLGNMGSRMAKNLVKAGYNVAVHDVNGDAMKIFAGIGVPTKKTPFEVAEESDVIMTMLSSSSHVFDVYTGPNGLLHGGNLLRPWLLIDSSTIDAQTSRKISTLVSNCTLKGKRDGGGVPMTLDAPVSGGVLAAEAGSLTFMVGGSEEAYLAAKLLLLSMGKSTIYCGGAGNGSAAKICNNLALAVSMLGVSEALALGQSLGIAASVLTGVFNSSSARCWSEKVGYAIRVEDVTGPNTVIKYMTDGVLFRET
ncbi:hypothetical protein NL676_014567 [Syzygium grande]|nr:hypothetical protein NL676_014567 [Syzygium grande]